MLTKVLAIMTCLGLLITSSILVLIYGWGLTPKSWWWIIGVGVFVNTALTTLTNKVLKEFME